MLIYLWKANIYWLTDISSYKLTSYQTFHLLAKSDTNNITVAASDL